MSEKEYKARIGEDKVLVYHPDPEGTNNEEFARQFQQAAASQPKNLQGFFIRLNEIQKQPVHSNKEIMKIELKNIKIYERLSQETISFSANIYINGVNVGQADNTGNGGATSYGHNSIKGKELIEKAEAWCKSLPPQTIEDPQSKNKKVTIPMNFEAFIDNILNEYINKKELDKFNKMMEKHQKDSVLFGTPDHGYRRLKFSKPLAEMLKFSKGVEAIKNAIQEKIHPLLKGEEKILNTNLPEQLMNLERKRPVRELKQQDISPDKKTGIKR